MGVEQGYERGFEIECEFEFECKCDSESEFEFESAYHTLNQSCKSNPNVKSKSNGTSCWNAT
jgi:hypothetical protein